MRALLAIDGPEKESVEWRLKCVILPTIAFKPSILAFGIQSERSSTIEQTVEIAAAGDVHSLVCSDSASWQVTILPVANRTNPARFRATIRSKVKLSPGRIADEISFTPVDAANQSLPAKVLKLTGDIVHDVVADPREIHYGGRECGGVGTEIIRLYSLTKRTFQVSSPNSDSADLALAPASSTSAGDFAYSARLRFAEPGLQRTVASFVIREDDGVEYTIAVPIRYHGVAKK